MSNISGVVEKVWENQTKAGTTYAYVIDNVRYGSYKTKLPIKEGDNVSFDAEQNGNFWNINVKTVKKLAAAPVDVSKASSGTATGWSGGKRDSGVQDAINYQSARKDALQLLDILASNQVIDFGKASKAKAFETALTYVDKLTVRFFEDTKALGHKTTEPAADDAEEAPVRAAPAKKAKPAPIEETELDDFEDETLPF